MGGGTEVNYPAPTQEERDLQRQQAEFIQQQRELLAEQSEMQEQLAPLLYEAAGLTPQIDSSGKITGFTRTPDPNAEQRQELETAFLERSLAAVKGELPVNPALIRDLDDQEKLLRERLRKQLGPGFENSTPGIQALSEFNERRNLILDASRRGDLTLSESLSLARSNEEQAFVQNFLSRAAGIQNQPLANVAAGSGTNAGVNALLSSFANQREGRFRAELANAQLAQQRDTSFGKLFGGIGQLAGLAAFSPAFSGTTGKATTLFGKLFA